MNKFRIAMSALALLFALTAAPPARAGSPDAPAIQTAVKQKQPGVKVGQVKSADGWALASWTTADGNGGGQTLLHKSGAAWKVVTSGGGAMDRKLLVSKGVPAATAAKICDF